MDLGIRGRKALVNGGSAGLGKGSARALAAEGVELYLSARGEERLQATAEEIAAATGASVTPIVADHATDAGREKILSVCPDPDILVGTCSPAPFTPDFREVTVEQWEEHLATGLISPIEFIRATVDGLRVGQVWTYGQVAEGAGLPGRARLVGKVLSNLESGSPLPWHRVVAAGGRIATSGRAAREQRRRLRAEGAQFRGQRVLLCP